MDLSEDVFVAKHVVTGLYATPEHVQESFEIQKALRQEGGPGQPLLEILLAKGHLDVEQADETRRALAEARRAGKLAPEGGAPAAAAPAAGVPSDLRIPGYAIAGRLGTGASGVYFRGREERSGREVAVKVLFPKYASDPESRRLFLENCRAQRALYHRNIARLHDAGETGGRVWAAQEYLPGERVDALVGEGPFEESAALEIGKQVAAALQHGASHGLAHGELRPRDVSLTPEGLVTVRFPLRIRTAGTAGRRGGISAEDAGYVAPEERSGAVPGDARTDSYALGVLLHHMVLGRPPVGGKSAEEVFAGVGKRGLPSPRETRPGTTGPFAALVERLSSPRPEDRPGDIAAITAALDLSAAGLEPVTDEPRGGGRGGSRPPARPGPRPASALRAPPRPRAPGGLPPVAWAGIGGGALLLLLLVVLGIVASSGGDTRPSPRDRTARESRARKAETPPDDPWAREAVKPPKTKDPEEPPAAGAKKDKPGRRDGRPEPGEATKSGPPPVSEEDESAARRFLDKAREKIGEKDYEEAAKILGYLKSNYERTRAYQENRDEIERLTAEVEGSAPSLPSAGPVAAPGGFLYINTQAGDWSPERSGGGLTRLVGRGRGTAPGGFGGIVMQGATLGDFTAQTLVEVRGDRQEGGAGLLFRFALEQQPGSAPAPSAYGFHVSSRGQATFIKVLRGSINNVATADARLSGDGPFHLAVIATGSRFQCHVNGKLVLTHEDTAIPSGQVGFSKSGSSEATFTEIRVDRGTAAIAYRGGSGESPPAPGGGRSAPPAGPSVTGAPPGLWAPVEGGRWSYADGLFEGDGAGTGSHNHCAWLDTSAKGSDFSLEGSVKLVGGDDAGSFAGLAFRMEGAKNGFEFYVYRTGKGEAGWRLARFEDERWTSVETNAAQIRLNEWVKLKVEGEGRTLRLFVDGMRVHEGDVAGPTSGAFGVAKYQATRAQWRNWKLEIRKK
ncbi:MAG: DUF1080 domain-containing protein [Planctomycetales bacterium]|nr:DUF1080 domain-containing protein [Planctomycetales bacterium]